jgi:hypothetical protein
MATSRWFGYAFRHAIRYFVRHAFSDSERYAIH